MAIIKPFKCIRPVEKLAHRVAALPYDVFSRKEAKMEVEKEPLSFLRIDRAETIFDDNVAPYDPVVYQRASELLQQMIDDGIFIEDNKECYYIYQLVMEGRAQTGLVACASIDDYLNNVIKKHENTREDKETDRIKHVDACNANTGPIFLTYRANRVINEAMAEAMEEAPVYSFTSPDGISHNVWRIDEEDIIGRIRRAFEAVGSIYIADGHHRAASAVKVGLMRRKGNPGFTGREEFNFFLSVLFPHNQLMIMPYNRVVRDLNGLTADEFLAAVEKSFSVTLLGSQPFAPDRKASFGMYLEGRWYRLDAKASIINDRDFVASLDVSILQDNLLGPVLGILDPRTDKRIDFIGGIRGLAELERRANEDMKVAFSMYPTSIEELFAVSDAGLLMPPKSTWFEPKLRSGLFIHRLS